MEDALDLAPVRLIALARQAWEAGRIEEAGLLFEAAANAAPDDAAALRELATFHWMLGRPQRAEPLLRRAIALAPDDAGVNHALGTTLLSLGRFGEAAPFYLRRPGRAAPALPFREWRGEPLAGRRFLLWPEQGIGDQIRFARFLPWLQAQGAEPTLVCHPALRSLFEAAFDAPVLAAQGAVEFEDPDFWALSTEMHRRAGVTAADIPPPAPLRVDPPAQRAAGIGVAWRGNPAHLNDARRSLPPELGQALLALPGAASLLPEDTGARDFLDTARRIAALSLVISVDTSIAHLAASLGKPVWLLLPAVGCDWRWMHRPGDSPWYPSMRLFRQPAPGDWRRVIDEVRTELARLT